MSNYQELVTKIKKEMDEGGRRTFSRETFDNLTKAYLNDVNNEATIVKKIGDEIEEVKIPVVKNFRRFTERILLDFGVDKQEASKILTNDYQFKNIDGLYELISESILNYTDTGKKFNFLPRKDLVCSLTMHEYDEETKVNVAPKTGVEIPTKYKKHKKIKVESTCPSWLREVIK